MGPILSKVKLSGAHLGPRLGQVAPTWSMLGTSWAQVEPMLGLGRPMLGLCWPRLGLCSAYVGVYWPHVGLCWPYAEQSWRLCCAYVGYLAPMLGKCEATYVPNTHGMSIKPVCAARITDTTGALLGASRIRRRPRNTVKNDVFHIMHNHAGRSKLNAIKICRPDLT